MTNNYTLDLSFLKCGLCNYLSLISNVIYYISNLDGINNLNIINFKKDMFLDNLYNISEIIDIDKTNINFKKSCINCTLKNDNNIYTLVKNISMFPIKKNNIFRMIEFRNEILNISSILKPMTKYYCIHFRLDTDCIIHHNYDIITYYHFINITDVNESIKKSSELINTEKCKIWLENIFNKYINYINNLGINNHYYICTPIGKDIRHQCVLLWLHKLLNYLPNKTCIQHSINEYREISAIIELDIIKSSEGLIGFSGSTFSNIGNILCNKYYID